MKCHGVTIKVDGVGELSNPVGQGIRLRSNSVDPK